jgi:hypothetical protein
MIPMRHAGVNVGAMEPTPPAASPSVPTRLDSWRERQTRGHNAYLRRVDMTISPALPAPYPEFARVSALFPRIKDRGPVETGGGSNELRPPG